jgi:hypothetical protein
MLGSTPATCAGPVRPLRVDQPRRGLPAAEQSRRPPGGQLEDFAIPCRTCPQSGWAPASARVPSPDTRLDTVSADQLRLRTPGSGWPSDGHGGPLDRPDGDGQAADTSSAQRPTLRLTSRTHARCWNPCKPGPRPMSAWSCPASTMDTTIGQPSGHRLPGRIRRTPSPPPRHAMPTGSDADRERTNRTAGNGRHSDTLDRHDHKGGPPGTPSPSCGARVCGLATKVGSAMATLAARP